MNSHHALDDLKAIRQMMERTRQSAAEPGGWYMVLWGVIWFFGLLGNQFLPSEAASWFWPTLTVLGIAGSVWIGIRSGRQGNVRSSMLRPLMLWWVALFVFDGLLIWQFKLFDDHALTLLIILTVALGYFQFGLFTHWSISLVGVLLSILVVGTSILLPEYFHLAMAFLGGGTLIVSGALFIRRGK
jgi:hypothetical protein